MVKYDDSDDGYSFRLMDESMYSDTTGSINSSYKQRIDSLFRDKRRNSTVSGFSGISAGNSDVSGLSGGQSEISGLSEISSRISGLSIDSDKESGHNGISNGLAELLAGKTPIPNGLPPLRNEHPRLSGGHSRRNGNTSPSERKSGISGFSYQSQNSQNTNHSSQSRKSEPLTNSSRLDGSVESRLSELSGFSRSSSRPHQIVTEVTVHSSERSESPAPSSMFSFATSHNSRSESRQSNLFTGNLRNESPNNKNKFSDILNNRSNSPAQVQRDLFTGNLRNESPNNKNKFSDILNNRSNSPAQVQRAGSFANRPRQMVPVLPPPTPPIGIPISAAAKSVQEELAALFGGREERKKAFNQTRSAVQSKIEQLYKAATAEPPPAPKKSMPEPVIEFRSPRTPVLPPALLEKPFVTPSPQPLILEPPSAPPTPPPPLPIDMDSLSSTLPSHLTSIPPPPLFVSTPIPSEESDNNGIESNGRSRSISPDTETQALNDIMGDLTVGNKSFSDLSEFSKVTSTTKGSALMSSFRSRTPLNRSLRHLGEFEKNSDISYGHSSQKLLTPSHSTESSFHSRKQPLKSESNSNHTTKSGEEEYSPPKGLPAYSTMKFDVNYLGALNIDSKTTSLDVLQEPLKELYYKYQLRLSRGKIPLHGGLQIIESGLHISHGYDDDPDSLYEITNPFHTIAVWAAVKLVIRKEMDDRGHMKHTYAFLPLICDPEAQDKYNFYHPLNVPDPSVLAVQHPPMFAVVMRKVGVPKMLECHGFVCQTPEDAIVVAANLYQALLETMRSETPSEVGSTINNEQDFISNDKTPPTRPPRKKRSSQYGSVSSSVEYDRMLRRSSSVDYLHSGPIILDGTRSSKRYIKRSHSDRRTSDVHVDEDYTRPMLPRSRSFVSVSDHYSYEDLLSEMRTSQGIMSVDEVLKQVIKPKGMSFSEMDPNQREMLLKLALNLSKDEIYQRSKNIMKQQKKSGSMLSLKETDSEGSTISSVLKATKRSFSRLGSRASSVQSSYNKDKSQFRKNSTNKNNFISNQISTDNDFTYLSEGSEGRHEYQHKAENAQKKQIPKTPMPKRSLSRTEGYTSCSECGYESECSSKCYCSLPRQDPEFTTLQQVHTQPKTLDRKNSPCFCDTESCAESEKCYCSFKRIKNNGVKMYEIDLDSESDTNTDVTVHSVGHYKKGYGSHSNLSEIGSNHAGSWKRLTDGSSSSAVRQRSSSSYLTEHSKARSAGTVFSMHPDVIRQKSLSSSLSTDSDISVPRRSSERSSGGSGYHTQDSGNRSVRQNIGEDSESLRESTKSRRHPSGSVGSGGSRTSSGSQSSASGSVAISNGTQRSKSSQGSAASQQKILLVSAVDPSGKVVYRGASQQRQQKEGSDTASILSMKKTAEIAALFSNIKLNQTTDLINTLNTMSDGEDSEDDDAYSTMQANNSFLFSDNIENSLGYLP
ncbi:unnamed protein product [Meganyctiphanes norvegica]|uniref:PID domain-containing protein n=1 Tax=Meganyctiphanes norvegica TaxID=48144 RepID=A0AAV2Q1E8_MEGNR